MALDSGSVLLDLRRSAATITAVQVRLRRPTLAPLLAGRSAASVAVLIPLLYAVCARAQGAAADAAIDAARGGASRTGSDPAVRAEAAGELALAVMTGEARSFAAEARRRARDPDALFALLETSLLGVSLAEWMSFTSLQALLRWANATDAPLAREYRRRLALPEPPAHADPPLPILEAADGLKEWPILTQQFAATPTRMGRPAETGPAARLAALPLIDSLRDRPLLQHWIARLVEFNRYTRSDPDLACGRVSAATLADGRGRAAVETARGTLLHEVTVAGDRITDYVIVAPTEWNFHPEGPLRAWLLGMPVASRDETIALAARAVEALDPCVECRYVVDPS